MPAAGLAIGQPSAEGFSMNRMMLRLVSRTLRPLALAAALGLGALTFAAPANAGGWHGGGWHGGGWHGGGWGCCWGGPRFAFSFGFPAYSYYPYPYYYPYPAYSYAYPYPYTYPYAGPAYPPGPSYPQQPPVVAQNGPPPQQNWYYCDNPRGYYPYVQSCGSGWRAVPAQPQGAPNDVPN